jgi:hypothetical protein
MGLNRVNAVLRGFYGHCRGLRRIAGRRLCRLTGQRAAETRRVYAPTSIYLIASFSTVTLPLFTVSVPIMVVVPLWEL